MKIFFLKWSLKRLICLVFFNMIFSSRILLIYNSFWNKIKYNCVELNWIFYYRKIYFLKVVKMIRKLNGDEKGV